MEKYYLRFMFATEVMTGINRPSEFILIRQVQVTSLREAEKLYKKLVKHSLDKSVLKYTKIHYLGIASPENPFTIISKGDLKNG